MTEEGLVISDVLCSSLNNIVRTDMRTGRRYNGFNIPISNNIVPLINISLFQSSIKKT